jgi:hypothetical protein
MDARHSHNILLLKGLQLSNLNTKPMPIQTPLKIYTILPKTFASVDAWPKKSNLKCWECGLVPTSYPKFLPLYTHNIDGNDICDVHGNFCEWSCVVRYIRTYSEENRYDLMRSISTFQALFTGNAECVVAISPVKTIMQDYCGSGGITEDEYRKKLK